MQWQVILAKAVWKREQYKGISQICSLVILVEVHLESVNWAQQFCINEPTDNSEQ